MAYKLFLGALAVLALVILQLRNVGRRQKGLPPGPPTLPLIGNLHQIPRKDPHHQFKKWAEEYGPVYSLILGTKVMIVLSSDQAVKDLMDKRSNIYSDRPDMYLTHIIGNDNRLISMPYGEAWRLLRKLIHTALHINKVGVYIPYQDLESKMMLDSIVHKPQLWIEHIRRYSHSVMTQVTFGFRTKSMDDTSHEQLYRIVEDLSEVNGAGASAILELYPLARNLPDFLLPTLRYAKRLHQVERPLFVGLWLDAKRAVLTGESKPCFAFDMVESQKLHGMSDELCGYTVASLLEAGSDTSANTLVGFMQAMVLFPAVQARAQEELDAVCGDGRLPTLDDIDSLPYTRACVKEALRWMPTPILGIPHRVIQDDEYMGYRIPAGAGVACNVWAIHMDERRHPRPREFDPLRYVDDHKTSHQSASAADASTRDHFVFGAGRRICQGMHVADQALFFAVSRLLWAFSIDKALDEEGNEIVPDADKLTSGFVVQPEPFPARITPRSGRHAEVLRRDWAACQELLDEEKQWKVKDLPGGLVQHKS